MDQAQDLDDMDFYVSPISEPMAGDKLRNRALRLIRRCIQSYEINCFMKRFK